MSRANADISSILATLICCKDPAKINQYIALHSAGFIFEEAIKHGVASIMYQEWKALKGSVINDLSLFANVDTKLNIIHQFLHSETQQAFTALKSSNIPFVVLKGYALSNLVYRIPHSRPRTDIDIIIEPPDAESVVLAFKKLGFSNPRGWQPKAIIDQFSFTKDIAKGIKLSFDIHLKISNDKTLHNIITFDELRNSVLADSTSCPQLIDKPFALIHAVIHLLNHRIHGDLVKLIWFYDIYLLVERINAEERDLLIKLIQDKKISSLFRAVLRDTNTYFPAASLVSLTSAIEQFEGDPSFDYLLSKPSLIFVMWHNFVANKGVIAKLNFIRETMFPPKQEIYLKYGQDTHWPLFLLYLRRIFTGAFKWITKS